MTQCQLKINNRVAHPQRIHKPCYLHLVELLDLQGERTRQQKWGKNTDFMMERPAKVPQNNQQLTDIKSIVKEKDRVK